MKLRTIFLIVALSVVTGCADRTNVSNIPETAKGPVATEKQVQTWYTATGNLKTIAALVEHATEELVRWNRAGVFPDGPNYEAALRAIGKAAQTEKLAVGLLETQPEKWDASVQQQINLYGEDIASALKEAADNGLAGIKNETAKASFKSLIDSAQSIVILITSIRGA